MNEETLADWERPYYEPDGGEPFLYYVVFGEIPNPSTISGAHYRFSGIPDGIEIMGVDRKQRPDVFAGFREEFVWEKLTREDPLLTSSIEDADQCCIIRGTPADETTLNYHRDVVGFMTYLLDEGAAAIYDPLMIKFWSPEDWRNQIFDRDIPAPKHHVMILYSEDEHNDQACWYHTRGMIKYGRPDLSIHGVRPEMGGPVIELLSRFIEMQAFGAIVPEGQEIRMQSLPDGMTCHHRGDHDDPEFNNVHIEILWPWA